jgi:hypothetical protein
VERGPARSDGRGILSPILREYYILREEYLLGMPTSQTMTRHSVGEGTFHRNRRRAVAALAQELGQEEEKQPAEQL